MGYQTGQKNDRVWEYKTQSGLKTLGGICDQNQCQKGHNTGGHGLFGESEIIGR